MLLQEFIGPLVHNISWYPSSVLKHRVQINCQWHPSLTVPGSTKEWRSFGKLFWLTSPSTQETPVMYGPDCGATPQHLHHAQTYWKFAMQNCKHINCMEAFPESQLCRSWSEITMSLLQLTLFSQQETWVLLSPAQVWWTLVQHWVICPATNHSRDNDGKKHVCLLNGQCKPNLQPRKTWS